MKTEHDDLTSEDCFNADAITAPIQAALEAAREEARTLTDDQLARALQCLTAHKEWHPDARLTRSVAIDAIKHIRTDRIRHRLLAHYGTKEPARFCQVDAWREGDSIPVRDDDGHGLTAGATFELMGGADVRVLIPDATNADTAVLAALIRKVADWVAIPGHLDGVRQMRATHEGPRPADLTDSDIPF